MKALFMLFCLLLLGGNAYAKTIEVPKDYTSIQSAIYAANDGDEIVISPGTYEVTDTNHYEIYKNITIRSTFDGSNWDIVKNTIIKNNNGCYFSVSSITDHVTIRGLTLTRDPYYPVTRYVRKQGIIAEGQPVTIEYNIIENCVYLANGAGGSGVGGAICSVQGGIIQNNIIRNNWADDYSALYNCGGIIRNNLIYNENGAQVEISTSTPVEFYNNTVYCSVGALCSLTPSTKVYNNVFWSGDATFGITPFDKNQLRNCVIKGFTGPGKNIITADPKFVDPSKGDFRLQASSPCIDAGLTTATIKADIIGVQRGLKGISGANDGATDIGAYEYKPKPVSVWLPNGGPDSVSAGDDLKVAWEMELPTAGTAILLQLFNGPLKVADLGAFWNPAGADESTVKLPRNIQARSTYTIRGVSSWNQTLYSNTPNISIASTFTAIPRSIWARYM